MKKLLAKYLPERLKTLLKTIMYGKQVEEVKLIERLFKKQPPPTRIMVDVGAHYGHSLLPFARQGWAVYAFEPDSENRRILEANLKSERLSNVYIDSRAVSDVPGRQMLFASDISTGISGLLDFHPSHKGKSEVDVITLNAFCEEMNITKIDFLKTDVEGYDLKVLTGIDLKRYSPEAVVCEFENNKTRKVGYVMEDLIAYLSANDYKVIISEWYPITRYGKRHRWKQFVTDASKVDDKGWGNLVGVKEKYYPYLVELTQ